ncbi:SGNH/GDSL hydrolase family protein [Roseateles sp. NT4]|uniref:SGNH/GDSL hydrolase family protein n=1 Tax=Roseateles sp. NT4 TaxID=3453715 RepID=UPI003EEDE931
MKPFLTRIAAASVALLGSVLVAGCGGGATADTTPRVSITSVKVFGDSIQDSGTFGYKFTVQSTDNLIYAERVAANYGQTLCNFFVFTGTTFAANTAKTGCTNYSIGGGRITYTGAGGAANPLNVGTQMATYAAAGSYTASDLVIIDGGGNDAADLVGAYLTIPKDGAKTYSALLGTLLTPAQIGAALQGGAATTGQIGATYMTALADKFAAQIKASVLDKGATHVVLMNMPDVSYTPRFQMVLDSIAAASGGGTTGAAARAQAQGLFQGWMTAFNTELAAKFAGNDSVIVIDFYKAFQDQVATPAQFGLTNVKTPACPITGVGSDGLPTYNFPTCTAAALSAAPPAGVSGGADWWKSYAFSDSFHPTPYGHQLTQQLIGKALATKGWL